MPKSWKKKRARLLTGDAVGVLNMANLHGEGTSIGVVAHPLLLRWNGMKWELKRVMNNGRSKNSQLQSWRASMLEMNRLNYVGLE